MTPIWHHSSTTRLGPTHPGKLPDNKGGRPPIYTEHAKTEVARVAMDDTAQIVKPTPARCREKLPRLTINKATGKATIDEAVNCQMLMVMLKRSRTKAERIDAITKLPVCAIDEMANVQAWARCSRHAQARTSTHESVPTYLVCDSRA